MVADACAEVPTAMIVGYNIARLRRVGYLPRFDGYLRQLGFTADERTAVMTADKGTLAALSASVAEREPWGSSADAHLKASNCQLAAVISDSAVSTIGLEPLNPISILEHLASLDTDVRLFIGVDPGRPVTLAEALTLRTHSAFGGLAVMPYLANLPLSDAALRPLFDAAAEADIPVWAHCSTHYRTDVAYDIGHPAHADAVLRRHPDLRLLIGHAGWPWVADACSILARFPNAAIEFSTFPPALIADPGWSLTPLLSRRREFSGRIFFGSGAVSSIATFTSRLAQLDQLAVGDELENWRGAAFLQWMKLR
jgi:predicted TIM-barrel fold metal-dependent hydrolase